MSWAGDPNWDAERIPPQHRMLSAAAVLSAVIGVGIAMGMSIPLVSLVVARSGYSDGMVGLMATIYSATMLLSATTVPWVIRRIGGFGATFWGMLLAALFILLFPLAMGFVAWTLLRILTAIFNSWNWVASEVWVNRLASAPGGGRLIGIYSTCFALGLVIGPLILNVTGTEGMVPFVITAGLMAISAVPVLIARNFVPPMEARPPEGAFRATFRAAPLLIFGSLVCGVGEGLMYAMFPLWGLELGLTEALAVLTVTAVALGNVSLQPVFGWVAERWPVEPVMAICAVVGLIGIGVLLLQTPASAIFWSALFVVGGFNAAFYTLSMVIVSRSFDAQTLPSANAAFVSAYTFGMLIGPGFGGIFLQLLPPHGVMLPLVGMTVLFLVAYSRFSRVATSEAG